MTHHRAVAFSGSLRTGSLNTALILMAQRLAPERLTIEILDYVDQLPWMNPDTEYDPPAVVQRLWDDVRNSDALIVGLPEYNWGTSALAKNAIDWLSRPADDRHVAGATIAFLSAASASGGQRAQDGIATVLGLMGATVIDEPQVRLSFAGDRLAGDGTSTDPEIEALVRAKLDAIVAHLDSRAAG